MIPCCSCDMFAYSLLGLRDFWMSAPACAKCRRGGAAEGDSWCLGCLAVENSLSSLKANWWSSSHRRLGEEILVQAAKQLRAVKTLDTSLQSFADSCEARLKKASTASGARKPPEPPHPPRSRAKLVEAPAVGLVVKQEDPPAAPAAAAASHPPESPGSVDWGAEEESSKSEREADPSPTPSRKRGEVYRQPVVGSVGAGRGTEHPPEHRERSRSPRKKKARGSRPGHRGGARHQRHYREHHQPGATRHRPWKGDNLGIPKRSDRGVLDEDI